VARTESVVMRHLPIVLFAAVYVITCLIGALFLIIDYRPFVELFEYFTAVKSPHLVEGKLALALYLLFVPPLALCVGFSAVSAVAVRRLVPHENWDQDGSRRPAFALGIFAISALLASASLLRAGAPANVQAWLSYETWIDARWQNFQTISFVEFVNIYLLMPLTAAWVAVSSVGTSIGSRVRQWTPTLIALALSLLLFQKKAALVVLTIVASAWLLHGMRRPGADLRKPLAAALSVFTALYFTMVVLPTFNAANVIVESSSQRERPAVLTPAATRTPTLLTPRSTQTQTAPSATRGPQPSHAPLATPAAQPSLIPQLTASPPTIVTSGPPQIAVALYALLAPVTRTSVPALYYPVVFPDLHDWYGLDLGQDIVCSPRLGCANRGMPNDGLVVWDYMNPTFHGGSVAAPFQFALYSQVGPIGAVIGALVLGAVLGLAWSLSRSRRMSSPWSELFGTLVLVLAIYLALDSPRNSILVSYGVIWGFLFLGAASYVSSHWDRVVSTITRIVDARERLPRTAP
jgi:hypothetical protein